MEFERENPNCKFSVPDRPTVRQQLEYISRATGFDNDDFLLRHWRGAVALIQDWECEVLPDHKIDLDSISDPSQRDVVIWAGLRVREMMNGLEDIPKNS